MNIKILEGNFYVTIYDKNTGIKLNKDGSYFNNQLESHQDHYEVFSSLSLAKAYAYKLLEENENIELTISNHFNNIIEIIE